MPFQGKGARTNESQESALAPAVGGQGGDGVRDWSRLMTVGVYQVENTTSGKLYVGSSVDIERRWGRHLRRLRRGRHNNRHWQMEFDRDGEGAFAFTILEVTTRLARVDREQWWLNELRPRYNVAPRFGVVTVGEDLSLVMNADAVAEMAELAGKAFALRREPDLVEETDPCRQGKTCGGNPGRTSWGVGYIANGYTDHVAWFDLKAREFTLRKGVEWGWTIVGERVVFGPA